MTRLLTFGLAFAFSAALAGHASAQVKLAVGGPITGGSAAFGAQIKQGTEQAVEDINAAGGIDGKTIDLVVYDTKTDPAVIASVASQLLNSDKVPVAIGFTFIAVAIYIPAGYYLERALFRRRQRKQLGGR